MKDKFVKTLVTFLVSNLIAISSFATEIIHYKNIPVMVELRKGQERSIQFGDHVKVGITKGQKVKNLFRIQSALGAVHILPYEEFDKQRIQLKRLSDGRVILLDLIAKKETKIKEKLEDVRIILDTENKLDENESQNETTLQLRKNVITPVVLTRYAAQQLYGPTRLHRDMEGIAKISLDIKNVIRIFKGQNNHKTLAKPIVAYKGGGYYLTAIHIRNISRESVNLNYLELNLPFSHATFQHHSLRPNGVPGDSTVLYLLSEKSLKETLYPWTYYIDMDVKPGNDGKNK